ncbi:MAG: sigma-54 dependent transcriptional regulator [Desulfobacterales bacterium]|nr:sigma-54 dependent transcriptional regulator [Desulfobacterales bacterium]
MPVKKTSQRRLLVIDDDKLFCDVVQQHFTSKNMTVLTALRGDEGLHKFAESHIDVVLLDQKLPDAKGIDLCPTLLDINDQVKIIFITAYPSFDNAVEAIKVGAFDYLTKPFEMEELDLVVNRCIRVNQLERVEQLYSYQKRKENEQTYIVGQNSGLDTVWHLVTKAALTRAPLLITGETGTGKNALAKTVHQMGPGQKNPFVSINCATLPENLIEDELFGHEKGTFTGALKRRRGLFEMAEGGTLLLDEIGTLPLNFQAKLLGVLDENRVRRLGGETDRPINVRVMATTNIDIEQAIQHKNFRDDLFFRLNVVRIHVPPLRKRLQDLDPLCRYFIGQMVPEENLSVGSAEIKRLQGYQWPGNIRELRNVIERSIILRRGSQIYPSELIHSHSSLYPPKPAVAGKPKNLPSLAAVEKKHIRHALDLYAGNRTQAAKALGISRSTLKRKLKSYRNSSPRTRNHP